MADAGRLPSTRINLPETTVTPRQLLLTFALAWSCIAPPAGHAQADKATVDALEGYFDFVDANAGTILPEQIPAEDYKKFHVLDVRDASQFAKDHIPGAVNMEWRQVFAQRAKLPKDKTILVYCNTSSFAAQVAMALRLDGFENVRLLYGGYNAWKARGGMDAYTRAVKKP
jgi:rhodanese-related sulfurtransferase